MLVGWHKSDYPKLANEDAVRTALGPLAIAPGDYLVPCAGSMDEMKSPQFAEKMKEGPVLAFTVRPNGAMSMGRNLAQWFVYCLVVTFFAAIRYGRSWTTTVKTTVDGALYALITAGIFGWLWPH